VLVGPRLLFAMGRDGLAPAGLMRLHPRYQTPAVATAVYAGWSCLLVIGIGALTRNQFPPLDLGGRTLDVNLPAGPSAFDALTDFAMFGAVAFETLAVASVFVFRRTRPDADRPYRCVGYPVVPAVYVLVMTAVLANMFATPEQRGVAVIGLGFIALGAVVYQVVFAGRGTEAG
jgi:amino acid transporter